MRFDKDSREGLEVCGFYHDLVMVVVVFKGESRMWPDEGMLVLKSAISERKSNLPHRSSIGLGIANLSFVVRLNSSKGPIIALVHKMCFRMSWPWHHMLLRLDTIRYQLNGIKE